LTRFLDADRNPRRLKTPCSPFYGRGHLVFGSIVNAAGNGKRLRVIDALADLISRLGRCEKRLVAARKVR
jgi:hypothetical protein